MLIIEERTIKLTRGDVGSLKVSAEEEDGEPHTFAVGDVVRITINEKNAMDSVVLQKDVTIEEEGDVATIVLLPNETKIGEVISKPVDYWYEIVVNPDTYPQTIIGYDDEEGAAIFRLLPEGDSE